ncbi:MAG: AraC family transcriptional regulator [Tissierellia bacterium]|nr:AraC family transcriptional regulator [Tissierellia bacterium]
MSYKGRLDFSYDLWGNPVYTDGNKFIFEMNPKYGQGRSISYISEIGIYPSLTEQCWNVKSTKESNFYYRNDAFFIGKVLKGNTLFKREGGIHSLLKEGDIFCHCGNFIVNERFHLKNKEKLIFISVFGYQEYVLKAFQHRHWNTENIKEFFQSPTLKEGILLRGKKEYHKILDDLYQGMIEDNRFIVYRKGLEFFHSITSDFKDGDYEKLKTYTETQANIVMDIKKFLDENLDTYYPMPKLAKMFNISLSGMQSIFSECYKISPYRYHLNLRLEKAKELIVSTDFKITKISQSLGFSSYDNFFKAYKHKYGCNPSEHRKKS